MLHIPLLPGLPSVVTARTSNSFVANVAVTDLHLRFEHEGAVIGNEPFVTIGLNNDERVRSEGMVVKHRATGERFIIVYQNLLNSASETERDAMATGIADAIEEYLYFG